MHHATYKHRNDKTEDVLVMKKWIQLSAHEKFAVEPTIKLNDGEPNYEMIKAFLCVKVSVSFLAHEVPIQKIRSKPQCIMGVLCKQGYRRI